jgi:cysteine desulfurase
MLRPIYLDCNGTTPLDPAVIEAMRPFLETEFGNPSSGHWYGIAPRQAVEKARRQVAGLLGCAPEEILFTSGGTESNNHAICGTAHARAATGKHIITSAVEHPAVLAVCRHLETEGGATTVLPVDEEGRVRMKDLIAAIRPDTVMISVMHANNEVGTIQPVAEIAAEARARGIVCHTDAAQSVGKLPTRVDDLGVDLLSVAGHKVYAPKGIGALYIRAGVDLEKFCHGAGQEGGRRAGTENVMQIVGLGKACEIAAIETAGHAARIRHLRDQLQRELLDRLDGVRVNGHETERLTNTLSISFKGLEANRILEAIGLEVAASAGAACHAGIVNVSHVLRAMAVPEAWAMGTVRFSLGRMTLMEEIDRTVAVVCDAVERLRQGL